MPQRSARPLDFDVTAAMEAAEAGFILVARGASGRRDAFHASEGPEPARRPALFVRVGARPLLDVDEDEDGFGVELDCDDANPAVNPGIAEVPGSGVDDDCDPETPACQQREGEGGP